MTKDQLFQMRVSAEFLKTIDDWRGGQTDQPPRAEAIRRLVERGMGRSGGIQQRAVGGRKATVAHVGKFELVVFDDDGEARLTTRATAKQRKGK